MKSPPEGNPEAAGDHAKQNPRSIICVGESLSGDCCFGPREMTVPLAVETLRLAVWEACGSPSNMKVVLSHNLSVLTDGELIDQENDEPFTMSVVLRTRCYCVKAFGGNEVGGDCSHVAGQLSRDVVSLCSNGQTSFAALKGDGSVIVWSCEYYDDEYPEDLKKLLADGVVSICSNGLYFGGLKDDGSVVIWSHGDVDPQLNVPGEFANAGKKVVQLFACSSTSTFVGVTESGTVSTWSPTWNCRSSVDVVMIDIPCATPDLRSQVEAYVSKLSLDNTLWWDGTTIVGATKRLSASWNYRWDATPWLSQAALKDDGTVMTWGYPDNDRIPFGTNPKGDTDANQEPDSQFFEGLLLAGSEINWRHDTSHRVWTAELVEVAQIHDNGVAFAAVKACGAVVTWGTPGEGGDSTAVADDLKHGVIEICSNPGVFAALKEDGAVLTWGDKEAGGDSAAVAKDLRRDVCKIYSNMRAFAAVKFGGAVVAWGDARFGGDTGEASGRLASGVCRIYKNMLRHGRGKGAFAALKDDGSVVTWGSDTLGGNSIEVAHELTAGVIDIYCNNCSFAARKANGDLVVWPDGPYSEETGENKAGVLSGVASVCFNDHGEFGASFAVLQETDDNLSDK